MIKTILSAFVAIALTSFAHAETSKAHETHQKYVGLVLGSMHIGPSTKEAASLNDNTPGITFGKRYERSNSGFEYFWEAGVFYNSYEEVSPVLLAGVNKRAYHHPSFELWVSAFTGAGYYKELGRALNEEYSLPYIAGFIPLAGAAISIRKNNHELRVVTVPGENLKAIANFSYTYSF